jgi:hypothetical protein
VYAREIDGQELSFGVSGKLVRNVLVMYDRQTDSLWSQLLGEAIRGDLQGTKLEYLPSWHMTWGKWKELHPDTLALEKGFRGSRDPYDSYYSSPSAGVIGETIRDDRLQTKEFVLGVELDEETKAYPFSSLSGMSLINDFVADRALLVLFDNETGSGQVFDRLVGDEILTFSRSEQDPAVLLDAETGSSWDAFSGTALDGPLAGNNLEPIKSTSVFWFGWKDFHPDTLVYDLDG